MKCPACGHGDMLFDAHHGMEHNVCQQCGTVIDCEALVQDIFEPGTRVVQFPYQRKQIPPRNGRMLNTRLKPFLESQEVMCQLMDRLNLPVAARELALHFLQYSKKYDRRCAMAASIYMAMKRHDIPVTIKYISNYLQVSHFSVGKVMKGLQKRIGPSAHGNAFSADRLTHLIFNQAKFGGCDGKRRYDLLLNKTEQLIQLLQGCQMAVNYQPHFFILACGYIVWRNLLLHGWKDDKSERRSYDPEVMFVGKGTMRTYLSEVGIQLSDYNTLYDKVNIISNLLSKFARLIPWFSDKDLSKNMIYTHLDDFLKYRSQIVALAGEDMPKEENMKVENECKVEDESSSKSCDQMEQNTVLVDCQESDTQEEISHANIVSEVKEGAIKFSFNFHPDVEYSSFVIGAESSQEKDINSSRFRKVKFIKLASLQRIHNNHAQMKKEFSDSEYSELENVGDNIPIKSCKGARKKDYPECFDFP